MKRTYLLWVVALIVLLGLAWAARDKLGPKEVSAPTPPPATSGLPPAETPPVAESVSITFTATGYSPASVTIKKGTTVTYRNTSNVDMWPASAIHPTHALYPVSGGCIGSTFDACRGYKPGESWSFNFDRVGTWKYHDHLRPTHFGAVIVTE